MINAQIYTDTLTAGQVLPRQFTGSIFKIISSTGAVNVKCTGADLQGLVSGQGFEKVPFERLEIKDASGATNTVRYVIANEGFLDGITGAMQITSNVQVQSGSFSAAQATVTNASGQIFAANTARKYLMIQNNDTSGTIYVQFGAAATVAAGVKIGPGGAYEMDNVQSTQAIHAIGSIASNANVVIVQG